ncbi:alanine--tRNA ligase-related protein [Candidatus Venteria ishoeyi]|uniref:Alanine--tRNA ligase n=1 Tax=Candidatus Venteria ishoeyi TaxID=1899563 RepID=A0A1H6FDA0_9GAMM|nr:alanine--tRNA ligase-related protein [Candidatus Venteria ishoeyi]SEH08048.1 Alanine--tRNA ligase [Candidatus Venteria ishoeyi]
MIDYNQVSESFLCFYQDSGFERLPTAPMLHPSVPMSFVLSAGLIQVETGLSEGKIQSGDKYVLLQNCFRHFDLESVGTDDTHLSLFEMAGAFHFGHTGRHEALQKIWYFVTEVLNIKKEHLWVSYFGGGLIDGRHKQPEDRLTYTAWKDIGITDERLIKLGPEDNFWFQRDGGKANEAIRKCGPHTELFYDFGKHKACSAECLPGCSCGRFMEFSNILFIENELNPDTKTLSSSPLPFVETVIGIERCTAVLHDIPSIFSVEPYKHLFEKFDMLQMDTDLSPNQITQGKRIILDHLRALCILVQDGAPPPGRGGRQRLMRKLFRRVMTQQLLLGLQPDEFFPEFIKLLCQFFSGLMYEIIATKLKSYYDMEYERFANTLIKGKREFSRLYSKYGVLTEAHCHLLQKEFGIPQEIVLELWLRKEITASHHP